MHVSACINHCDVMKKSHRIEQFPYSLFSYKEAYLICKCKYCFLNFVVHVINYRLKMPKSKKKKNQDFQKVKLKVGRKLQKADNVTNASFKTRSVQVVQHIKTGTGSEPTTRRNLNIVVSCHYTAVRCNGHRFLYHKQVTAYSKSM